MIKRNSNKQDIYIVNSDTKLFEVQPNKINNSYSVAIDFSSKPYYMDRATGVIDTGASNTIISIRALYGILNPMQRKIIEDAGIRINATRHNFSSAKGTHDLPCMLCSLPEITIGKQKFRNFPFYLLLDANKSLVLIGYDFISSCDVVQMRNGNIAFYNYSRKDMLSKFPPKCNVLNLLSVEL